jgi:hypothetical protein
MISRERVNALLRFDRATGKLFWRKRPLQDFATENAWKGFNTRRAGREAGCTKQHGYRTIYLDGRAYYAHRLAWLIAFGEMPESIDHINGNTVDNRIENLRTVSQSENAQNLGISRRNSSGVLGVHWSISNNGWVAQIRVHNEIVHLGTFHKLADAASARARAERRFGFHPNHGARLSTKFRKEIASGVSA